MRIGIAHDFFKKGLNDYANWQWAWVRELIQNGCDAGAAELRFNSSIDDDGNTVMVVRNDAPPMDEDTLLNKFLALGGTTKEFDGTTGGFGIAKTVIALAHLRYKIRTGSHLVEGSGGEFELSSAPYIRGTETTVVFDGLVADELKVQFEKWCFYAQVKCTMYWNDEPFECDMRKGSQRRDLGFGKVYTNRSTEHQMVVRMNGMPMFVQRVGIDRCIVVELEGKSNEQLTSNRDALIDTHRWDLSSFVTELSVDKRSALKAHHPKYRHYDGSRLCHRKARNVQVSQILDLDQPEQVGTDLDKEGSVEFDLVQDRSEPVGVGSGGSIRVSGDVPRAAAYAAPAPVQRVRVAVGEEFVIKNETDLVVPTYYRPDELDWSSHSQKLARIWGRLMLQVHRTFDAEDSFAIGFLFTDDTSQEAEFEEGRFGKVYYICPAKLVEQSGSYSKSWKRRWKLTDRSELLMAAVHEFLHGRGYSYHDEDYANHLTSASAKVINNRKDFNWCFK